MLKETVFGLMRVLINSYARVMFRMDVQWYAPLPEGGKILAPNHPSTTDPFLVAALVSENPRILIDETLFKVPVLGTALRLMEHVPVIEGHGRIAYETAKWLLKTGHTVVLFPEGQISPVEGGFRAAHTGVARLALETGVPVVPVGIDLDRSRIRMLETKVQGNDEEGTWYLDGPYAMTVGQPLWLRGDVTDRTYVRTLSGRLMHRIAHLADQSARRLAITQPAKAKVMPTSEEAGSSIGWPLNQFTEYE
jgi:1-acyl-sn-glycerol-3-phosphate acyltransferase